MISCQLFLPGRSAGLRHTQMYAALPGWGLRSGCRLAATPVGVDVFLANSSLRLGEGFMGDRRMHPKVARGRSGPLCRLKGRFRGLSDPILSPGMGRGARSAARPGLCRVRDVSGRHTSRCARRWQRERGRRLTRERGGRPQPWPSRCQRQPASRWVRGRRSVRWAEGRPAAGPSVCWRCQCALPGWR